MLNFNKFLSKFKSIDNGYDPISSEYAEKYFKEMLNENKERIDNKLLLEIKKHLVPENHKSILDLGGGPGYYSLYFSKLGYEVTYLDISANFLRLAKSFMKNENINYQLSYMDNFKGKFDVIFSRVSWYYCFNDFSFIKKIYNNLSNNGFFIGVLHNRTRSKKVKVNIFRKIQIFFYDYLYIKVGHIDPTQKRIFKIFASVPFSKVIIKNWGKDTLVICYK